MGDEIVPIDERPTKKEITRFLSVFTTLDAFEAQHRLLRNWGAFDPAKLPDHDVIAVVAWLKGISE